MSAFAIARSDSPPISTPKDVYWSIQIVLQTGNIRDAKRIFAEAAENGVWSDVEMPPLGCSCSVYESALDYQKKSKELIAAAEKAKACRAAITPAKK